jgi:hypothetical protein
MQIPSDYRDLLRLLNRHRVRYLIVGAYAVAYYTEPRYTKDLDIWIESKIENARRVYGALREFGAPLKDITVEDFTNKNLFYQIGVAPVRVDMIMGISDIDFKLAWKNRNKAIFEGIRVNVIGINELIKSKEKTGRPFDLKDIEILKLRLKLKRR